MIQQHAAEAQGLRAVCNSDQSVRVHNQSKQSHPQDHGPTKNVAKHWTRLRQMTPADMHPMIERQYKEYPLDPCVESWDPRNANLVSHSKSAGGLRCHVQA